MKNLAKKSSLVLLLVLFIYHVHAQEKKIYMPKEIQKAYDNGTRSWTGEPGEKYWHNTVDYKIDLTVEPSERVVSGSEEVTYFNNSPDDLGVLVVRLYHNAFKKGNARLMSVAADDINDGVDVSDFLVDGEEYSFEQDIQSFGTNLYVRLRTPLESGKSITFSCNWKYVIPLTVRRTGAIDSTSFFVAYWYPQVAVYDDVFGWDDMEYTFQTEFYNNLGNYDVTLNVPKNFTVWATGELQNAQEVLNSEVGKRFSEAKSSTETVHLLTAGDLEGGNFEHSSGSWHFKAREVSDFAFAMSDHYLWDAASQQVGNRQVLVNSAFPLATAQQYDGHTQMQRKSMEYMSEGVPGVGYPYPVFTTFIGLRGGGMEFPMMANNAGPGRGVTIHEMFHTYFPMYVRINERRFAWMDEGWADFVTARVTNLYFEENGKPPFAGPKSSMQGTIGTISDLPLITSSQFMDNSNYGYASYPLPSFVYGVLNDYLGEERFLQCLQAYIDRWKMKSPTPYDFFYTFENVSGEDLSWFWNPWFFEFGYPDVKVKELDGKDLIVENIGTKPVPLTVDISYEDGTTNRIQANAKVWSGDGTYAVEIKDHKKVSMIMINKDVPDMTLLGNIYPTLEEIYSSMETPEDIPGSYKLNEFPVTAVVDVRDGAFFIDISGAPISTYLLPVSTTEYESIDGSIKVEFLMTEGKCSGMNMAAFGYNLTSSKLE